MKNKFKMEFARERFENEIRGSFAFNEFLCALFDKLGYPNMRITAFDNHEQQTKVFQATWEDRKQ